MRNLLYFIFFSLLVIPGFSQMPKKAATARLNGIDLYYETYGQGEPLFLLHGWTQSSQSWREHIATYAAHFEVYAIDLRGHGNTSPLTEEFSIQKAANDIVALMHHLKLGKTKAVGLSYGGILLLQISSQHPDKITSMVLIGAAYNYSGSDNQELNETFAFENLPPEFIEQLHSLHPQGEEQIRALFDPDINYEIRLTAQDLQKINTKTLVVSGDRDEVVGINTPFELHQYLPNSYLWVLPNSGHTPIYGDQKTEFLRVTMDFLKDIW